MKTYSDNERDEQKAQQMRLEEKAKTCVLTISAPAYAAMHDTHLNLYRAESVEARDTNTAERVIGSSYPPALSARGGLAALCEELGAEVIVDVRPAIIPRTNRSYDPGDRTYLIGTALIPKTK